VSLYDWLLALHVLSAFAWVSALVLYSIVLAAAWGASIPGDVARLFRATKVGDALIAVGMIGTIVFGVWLALYVDGYSLLDGWIIGALVLFAIVTELGRRARVGYERSNGSHEVAATGNAALWHWLRTIGILVILVLMIYKPGA